MTPLPHPVTVLQLTSSRNMSGGTKQMMLLSRGLVEAGHRVLFCAPDPSPALAWARGEGFVTRAVETGKFPTQWRAGRALRGWAREAGVDLIHAHHTEGHNIALLATFGGGLPPVIANRGVLFKPHFPAKFRSRRTSAIITNSEAVKGVLTAGGVPPAKIHVVYNANPVDPEPPTPAGRAAARRELGVAGDGPVVGAVGSWRPEKGFPDLVEAFPAVLAAEPAATLTLVGGGIERFAERLSELGVADRCRLLGHRPDAAMLIAGFDVLAFPSVDMDSCPNVVLEAMAAAVPVVGTEVGGVPELVQPGRTGWIVPPSAPPRLAAALAQALADLEQAAALGREGRRRVEREFSLDAKVRTTLGVYAGVGG